MSASRFTPLPEYLDAAQMVSGMVEFDHARCKQCRVCATICPGRAIEHDKGSFPQLGFVSPGVSACIACGCCLAACPEEAITITRGFRPGLFYRRLSQETTLTYPHCYQGDEPAPAARAEQQELHFCRPSPFLERVRIGRGKLRLARDLVNGTGRFLWDEARRGALLGTMRGYLTQDLDDICWAELLEDNARRWPERVFLRYRDERLTYAEADRNANRVAQLLRSLGGGPGRGLGLLMRNSPRFLDAFFATQKLGMYSVPINPELRGAQLAHVIAHSDIDLLLIDAELLPLWRSLAPAVAKRIAVLLVNDREHEGENATLPDAAIGLGRAYLEMPATSPGIGHDPNDICLIIYTSGTTGPAKGVVYRYRKTKVKMMCLGARVILRSSDVYYTAFPLTHGNALLATVTMAMGVGCTVALERRFSASRFWDDIRRYDATVFNTIGSIVPILLKQPERPSDRQHRVRLVNSAGCPSEMWQRFEQRFGVTLYEIYGAVDGGGKGIFNFGNAPVGSIGKPSPLARYRIVDASGTEVPTGEVGELWFALPGGTSRRAVEYYKNAEASAHKASDGWLRTGDLVRRDRRGYLYFVGRNTDSMRKGGENVSAHEVEQAILQHPAVEEVAVYAVPSELAEDEICAAIKRLDGQQLAPAELWAFLDQRLARFAVPRYLRFVDDFVRTSSHRIVKAPLQHEGVTAGTHDRQDRPG